MEFLRLAFLDYLEHRYDDDDSIKLMKPIQQTNQTIIECRRYRLITLNEHDQHLMALTTRLLSRTRFNDGIVNNNDKNVKKPTIRSKSSSSSSTTTRRKRELQNIFRWIDDKTIIESLNNRNESELFKHHHHHHHRNQRRRQTSEKQQQHSQQQSKDNGQPAVDFFQQPQPTDQPTIPGFTWLTSYSRIPFKVLNEYCTSLKKICIRGDRGLDGIDGLPGEPGLEGTPGRDGVDGRPGVPGAPGKSGISGNLIYFSEKMEPMGNPGSKGKRGPPGQDGKPGITVQAWHHQNDTLLIAPIIDQINPSTQTLTVRENEKIRLSCVASGYPKPKITWRRDDDRSIYLDGISHNLIESNELNISQVSRDNFGPYRCVATNGIPPAASQRINLLVTFPPLVKILLQKQMIGTRKGSWVVLECYIEAYPEPFVDWIYGDGQIIVENEKFNKSEEILESRISHSISRRVMLNITNVQNENLGLYKCLARNQLGRTYGIITLYETDSKTATNTIGSLDKSIESLKEESFVVYGELPKPIETKIPCAPCPTCTTSTNPYASIQQQCKQGQRPEIINMGVSVIFNHTNMQRITKRNDECHLSQIGKPVFYGERSDQIGCWMRDPNPIRPEDGEKYWLTRIEYNRLLEEYDTKEMFRNRIITKNYTLLYPFAGNGQAINSGIFYYAEQGTYKLIMFNMYKSEWEFINLEPNPMAINVGLNIGRSPSSLLPPLSSSSSSKNKLPRHVHHYHKHQHHYQQQQQKHHNNRQRRNQNVDNQPNEHNNVLDDDSSNDKRKLLYTNQLNYMDISVDENGAWVIYPNIYSELNNTIIMKFNATRIEFIWNLTVDYNKLGETFIMCGILYGIDSTQQLHTHIAFAYDLYKNVELKHFEQIEFTNPFMNTTYVGYNSKHQTLYTWDKGNILEYLLKIEMIAKTKQHQFNNKNDDDNIPINSEHNDDENDEPLS
ncbi:Olfactomedin-like domain protein [Dermatophagoides pteronyssinus]|uniref:Olfactomedin-like domain protein n=1 Tax=Dermatophagoides pteronyssinus TaxID=6956 RepID=A0ABQ8ISK1_DERPT|nr:Olfactomedin-like domain protein [Dermatophagoides pteronyssinus]